MLNYRKSSWLNRYLHYRTETPFALTEAYLEFADDESAVEKFDDCLYSEVKENGILFGCPVISESLRDLAKKLYFPRQRGGTILLFLETLFSIAFIENQSLTSNSEDEEYSHLHQARLLKIFLLFLQYHLPDSYFRIPQDVPLQDLLDENESLNGALQKLELVLIDTVTLQGYSSLGNRQNNFAFAKLYFFLLWARENAEDDVSAPEKYLVLDRQLREEMIIMFAALIWADDFVADTEQQVIEKYIEQTGLKELKVKELIRMIREPVKISDLHYSFTTEIISNYLVEQLILLSLINNQEAWQERELIEKISLHLGLSHEKLEQLYYSVADFFYQILDSRPNFGSINFHARIICCHLSCFLECPSERYSRSVASNGFWPGYEWNYLFLVVIFCSNSITKFLGLLNWLYFCPPAVLCWRILRL